MANPFEKVGYWLDRKVRGDHNSGSIKEAARMKQVWDNHAETQKRLAEQARKKERDQARQRGTVPTRQTQTPNVTVSGRTSTSKSTEWAPDDGLRAAFEKAIKDVNTRSARLMERIAQREQEIRNQFELAETDAERARLAWELGNLEAQRNAASQAITTSFNQGNAHAMERANTIQGRTAADVAAIRELYDREIAGLQEAAAASRFGEGGDASNLGVGLTAVPTGNYEGVLAANSAAGQQLAQSLNQISADDVAMLAQSLNQESQAQQGDLARLAMALAADAQMRHYDQVNDRINRERMMQQEMLARLFEQQLGLEASSGAEASELALALAEAEYGDRRALRERLMDREDLAWRLELEQALDQSAFAMGSAPLVQELDVLTRQIMDPSTPFDPITVVGPDGEEHQFTSDNRAEVQQALEILRARLASLPVGDPQAGHAELTAFFAENPHIRQLFGELSGRPGMSTYDIVSDLYGGA